MSVVSTAIMMNKVLMNTKYGVFIYTILEILNALFVEINLDPKYLTILIVVMGIDMLTGISKTIVLGGSVTSEDMRYGIIKRMVIILMLIWFHAGISYNTPDSSFIDQFLDMFLDISTASIIITELYSIVGNAYAIVTKEDVEEDYALKNLLGGLMKLLSWSINVLINKVLPWLLKFLLDKVSKDEGK